MCDLLGLYYIYDVQATEIVQFVLTLTKIVFTLPRLIGFLHGPPHAIFMRLSLLIFVILLANVHVNSFTYRCHFRDDACKYAAIVLVKNRLLSAQTVA